MIDFTTLKKEPIGDNLIVYTTSDYLFGTDAILLSNFSNFKSHSLICDLGTGNGIIPFLMYREGALGQIYGIDIQSEAIELANMSKDENNADSINFICCDLKELKGVLKFSQFDVVTCNPPYKICGGGIKNPNFKREIARHEVACTLEDVVCTASSLLKSGGKFCLCQKPERLTDVICLMRQYHLEPKRLRFVYQRVGSSPWLFLIEGQRDRKPGIIIMPPLYIERNNGDFTEEMLEIYGKYKSKYI